MASHAPLEGLAYVPLVYDKNAVNTPNNKHGTKLCFSTQHNGIGTVTPDDVTSIIPAAGRGTRLNRTHGKLLVNILGRPLIDWVIALLAPYSTHIIIVTRSHEHVPNSLLSKHTNNDVQVLQQARPLGTADTVRYACDSLSSQYSIVHWVDQITLRHETLSSVLRFCHQNSGYSLVFPTAEVHDPYVHLVTNPRGRLIQVLQQREGDSMPKRGRKDLGSFVFRTHALQLVINTPDFFSATKGQATGEYNLLPLFPFFEQRGNGVAMLDTGSEDEGKDVNAPQDIGSVTQIMRRRLP